MRHISLLIIGAGPIGLSCGIAAQAAGISYKIIDKGCLVNSIHNFPEDMTFFSSSSNLEIGNIPFTSLALRPSKQEGLEYYRRVAEHFDLEIGLYESFLSMERLGDAQSEGRFKLTSSKESYSCDFIVNATGFFDIPVLMDVPGESLDKVKHYFTSAHHLFRQKVTVIGASNSAIDVALEAYRKGAEVTVLVRGATIRKSVKYWIRPDFEGRVAEGKIRVEYNTNIHSISENHIAFEQGGEKFSLENDFVFAMTGYHPNIGLCEQLGIQIDPGTGLLQYDPETMETNASSVYLAGVVCGGMNTREWFIENSRDHGEKILSHISQHIPSLKVPS